MRKTMLAVATGVVMVGGMAANGAVRADEGMWLLNELNKQNLERMKELGFNLPYDSLHSEEQASLSQAVVIFG